MTKQRLIDTYVVALNKIELDLQRLRAKEAKFSIARLERLQKQVLAEIKSLNASSKFIITSGYVKNFDLSYYGNGYEFERYANTIVSNHVELGYMAIDRDYVIASLNQRIAGETFGERMSDHIMRLRRELKQSVAVAMIQGDDVATTARNITRGIDGVKKAMNKSVNSSLRIARTELLKAYSLAQEISTNQAEAAGVDVAPSWDATLDGKTRADHKNAEVENNGKFILSNTGEWVKTVGGVIFSSPRVVVATVGGSSAKQVVNCRCRRRSNVFGFTPVVRVARRADGTWEDTTGNLNYAQWAKTLEGRKEISRTIADRALRAKELRIMRSAKDRKFTTTERKTLADIRKQIKGRAFGNVATRI